MKARREVIKNVKPSGNSGGVYVPKEWIGRKVEVRLYSVEAMVLEALYPYLDVVEGIYLCDSSDKVVEVLVVAREDLQPDSLEGVVFDVVRSDSFMDYLRSGPADWLEKTARAVPLMNESLLGEMRELKVDDSVVDSFHAGIGTALAVARALEEDGDLEGALYSLISRARDRHVVSGGGIDGVYEALEAEAAKRGIPKERFGRLYGIYKARKAGLKPEYRASRKDLEVFYGILEEEGSDEKEKVTKEVLLERARRYREACG
ncbi:MAG: DUF2080 family transposase-associated protein [Candidatus Altiarchaeota archaeon]|nr:DUF2080 family transposase-associated protein [Candidatus Altiarchaeota archaeon]